MREPRRLQRVEHGTATRRATDAPEGSARNAHAEAGGDASAASRLWAGSLAAMGLSIVIETGELIAATIGFPIGRVLGGIALGLALYLLGVGLAVADWNAARRRPTPATSREILRREVARARAERARRAAEFAARKRGIGGRVRRE